MQHIQFTDKFFNALQRRAVEAGYESVDKFVVDTMSRLVLDEIDEDEDCGQVFTPERLAEIDKTLGEMKAGKFYTDEQADAELAKRRAEWLRKNHR